MMQKQNFRSILPNCGGSFGSFFAMLKRMFQWMVFAVAMVGSHASARMTLLSPGPDEFVPIEDFFMVISAPAQETNVQKVRLFFDKEEVTAFSRHTAATISFLPDAVFLARPGMEGPHRFTAILYGPFGKRIEEFSTVVYLVREEGITDSLRTVMIEAGKKLVPVKPLEMENDGRVIFRFGYETFQDTGTPVAEVDAWGNGELGEVMTYDYNLTLRTDENRHHQSLQRFRTAVGYRSIARISIGDNWPTYQQSILTRQRVRGLELNLKTPGKSTGLDIVWGQVLEPVEPFVVNRSALEACSTYNDSVGAFAAGTYERTLLASRLLFGRSKNFTISATVLKASDAVSSIDQLTLVDSLIDDTVITGSTPMDNIVFGAEAQMRLFRGMAQLYGSFAMSWLTKDITDGPLSLSDLERLFGSGVEVPDPEDLEWLFILNESTIPLPISADTSETVNMTSLHGAMNWDAGFRLRLPGTHLRNTAEVRYFYAGPHYASLGNPLQQVDRAGWLINLETHLFDNKMLCKGNLTWYDKDLFEMTGTPIRAMQASMSGSFTPGNGLPTIMLLTTVNDERSRTDDAEDPDRKNIFTTIGGALHYSPSLAGLFQPSINLSYYNSGTEITTTALDEPFSMRTHTVIVGITSNVDGFPLEPCMNAALNHSTGDVPLTLGSLTIGTRWRVIPKVFNTDLLFCFANTNDRNAGKRNEYAFKTNCRYEFNKRQSLWADAALKWTVDQSLDRRIKINYEIRY